MAALASEVTSSGSLYIDRFEEMIIVVDNLWDNDSFPCNEDWYRNIVLNATGKEFENECRTWYNDHVDHIEEAPKAPRASYLVDYRVIF